MLMVALGFAQGLVGKVKTHVSGFLAFRLEDKARSRLNCDSSSVLSIIFMIMKLCCSTKPLLNAGSAAVTFPVMFMGLHVSKNAALAFSPPFSGKNLMAAPKF